MEIVLTGWQIASIIVATIIVIIAIVLAVYLIANDGGYLPIASGLGCLVLFGAGLLVLIIGGIFWW